MDYWRLADELSVIDAAILITGNDPSERIDIYDDNGTAVRDENGAWRTVQRRDYEGFDAVFKALRFAILSDKLKATIGLRARDTLIFADHYYIDGERRHVSSVVDADGDEVCVPFDTLIRTMGFKASIFTNRQFSTIENAATLYVLKEPAWSETTIQVEDLKAWLNTKGLAPTFFFPQGKPEGFRDKNHPRYSAKLACAVAAWEAIKSAKPNTSVKATVEEWVTANSVLFGMVGKDGLPTKKAIEEVAVVVNWNTTGGAVATYTEAETSPRESTETIKNFSPPYPSMEEDFPF